MPKTFLAMSLFAAASIASLFPAIAHDYSSYLRQGVRAAPCANQDYVPCRAGCYYNSGYAYGSYDDWVEIRLLKAGIPGSPDAGGGPTGASQATNRPNASNEKY